MDSMIVLSLGSVTYSCLLACCFFRSVLAVHDAHHMCMYVWLLLLLLLL
jgi:hypothetical protein